MSLEKSDPISSLTETLDKIKKSIDKSIVEPISALENLTDSISGIPLKFKAISDAFANINADGKVSLSELGSAFSDVGSNLAGLKNSLGTIQQAMKVLSKPAGALVAVFGYLYTTNDEFRESINNLVTTLMSALEPILDSIKYLFSQIGTTVADLAGMFVSLLVPVINTLTPVIKQLVDGITPLLKSLIDMAISILPMLVSSIMPVISVLIEVISGILPPLLEALMPVIDSLLKMIADVLPQLVQAFLPIIEVMLQLIGEVLPPLIKALMPILDIFSSLITQLLPPLFNALLPIIESLLSLVSDILPPLMEAILPILDILMEIIHMVLPILFNALVPLLSVCKTLMDIILPILSKLLGGLANVFSGVLATAVENVSNILQNVFMPILDIIRKAIEFFCKLFKGDFKGALQAATGFFISFANGVIKIFSGVIQFIINSFANFLNFFINMINGAIKVFNYIPGVKIGLIANVDWSDATSNWKLPENILPKMAKGGVATGTTVAMIGEGRYPEAVVPLGASPQFASMKADIANAVIMGMSAVLSGNGTVGSETRSDVVINIDSEKLARVMIPAINKENKRKGFVAALRSV